MAVDKNEGSRDTNTDCREIETAGLKEMDKMWTSRVS